MVLSLKGHRSSRVKTRVYSNAVWGSNSIGYINFILQFSPQVQHQIQYKTCKQTKKPRKLEYYTRDKKKKRKKEIRNRPTTYQGWKNQWFLKYF